MFAASRPFSPSTLGTTPLSGGRSTNSQPLAVQTSCAIFELGTCEARTLISGSWMKTDGNSKPIWAFYMCYSRLHGGKVIKWLLNCQYCLSRAVRRSPHCHEHAKEIGSVSGCIGLTIYGAGLALVLIGGYGPCGTG